MFAIVTADNAGKLGKGKFNTAKLLGGPEIDHYHQAVAVVVAETFEQARAAAALLRVDYVRTEGSLRSRGREGLGHAGPGCDAAVLRIARVGDFERRLRCSAGAV